MLHSVTSFCNKRFKFVIGRSRIKHFLSNLEKRVPLGQPFFYNLIFIYKSISLLLKASTIRR